MPPKPAALPALAISMLAALVLAPGAGAAGPRFSCGASAVQAATATPPSIFHPIVASGSPCHDASATNAGPLTATGLKVGATAALIHANARYAGRGAGAFAAANKVVISSPSEVVAIENAQAQVVDACAAGSVTATSDSQAVGVTVNGTRLTTPVNASSRIALGSGGSYLQLNQLISTATSLTRIAVLVHLVGVGDYVIAEATATHSSSACAKTTLPSAMVQPCPSGSTFVFGADDCVIATTRSPIVLGAPFGGPTGGRVISLAAARAAIKSPCVHGKGPQYALIGVPSSGAIIGTRGADRILAFSGSYIINGRGGKDCIDVAGGNNQIRDGNAAVRIFAGSGFDKITVGNGNDLIHGGLGIDNISAGNGNDRIFAGAGADKITVGNGNDVIRLAPGIDTISAGNGNDRIIGSAGVARISAGTGNDFIFSGFGIAHITARGPGAHVRCGLGNAQIVVKPQAAAYAGAHGCKSITVR